VDLYAVDISGVANGQGTEPGRAALNIAVRVNSTPPVELVPSEMTERQRAVVERGVRRRLVAAAFGDSLPLAAQGDSGAVIDRALVEAIDRLGADRSDAIVQRVSALLDLLDLDRRHVPFDAQTRFHDHFPAAAPIPDARLADFARRLGFGVESTAL
jgi:hypothetical protein